MSFISTIFGLITVYSLKNNPPSNFEENERLVNYDQQETARKKKLLWTSLYKTYSFYIEFAICFGLGVWVFWLFLTRFFLKIFIFFNLTLKNI